MAIYRRAFHYIEVELDSMQFYVDTMKTSLRAAEDKNKEWVRKQTENMPEEKAQEFVNDWAESDICLGDLFPALSASSSLVSIMSFVEHSLAYVCREVESAKHEAVTKRFDSPVIKNCISRLKELAVPVPATQEYQTILDFQETRNAIVHQLGELDRKEIISGKGRGYQVYQFLRKRPDATLAETYCDGPYKIIPTHAFCTAAIECSRSFLKSIVDSVPKELYRQLEDEEGRVY